MVDMAWSNKYKIVAISGKSGVGKDTIQRLLVEKFPNLFNGIVSTTSRPPRENEVDGVDYHYKTTEYFAEEIDNFLEIAFFREWVYGTEITSLSKDKINIGVFNPTGIKTMLEEKRVEVIPIELFIEEKERIIRILQRESCPDTLEVARRILTDHEDFSNIDYDRFKIKNIEGKTQDVVDKIMKIIPWTQKENTIEDKMK